MNTINSTQTPSAHITVNRNRLKYYAEKVYLKSGTHFEIELWNPCTKRVLVHIKIDNLNVSSDGIIVNPGQRVYLERWVNDPKKFLFKTYEVEDSLEAKAATVFNGRVQIDFHDEIDQPIYNNYFYYPTNQPYDKWWNTNSPVITCSSDINTTTLGGSHTFSGNDALLNDYASASSNYSASSSDTKKSFCAPKKIMMMKSSIETGRTEKGEVSNQHLSSASGNFNTYARTKISWQILPESHKPVEMDKIRSYCTECGTRIRSNSWKHCPSCGTSLSA